MVEKSKATRKCVMNAISTALFIQTIIEATIKYKGVYIDVDFLMNKFRKIEWSNS